MKSKPMVAVLIALLLPCASAVASALILQANDIGLLEAESRPYPSVFFDEARIVPYDEPSGPVFVHGWVNVFGNLAGGTYFFTDLFTLPDTHTVNVSWDFTGTDRFMQWIDAVDGTGRATFKVNISGGFGPVGDGVITMPNGVESIAFFGSNHVPENGTAAAFLGLGLLGLVGYHFHRKSI